MQKKLTGWLIVLIALLVLSIGSAASAAAQIDQEFHSLLATYPSVRSAIMALKLFNGAMVCVSLYTAWLLYRKESGTLRRVQAGLALRFACVAAGSVSFPILAGLPSHMTAALVRQATYNVAGSIVFTSLWLFYLIRSVRVREIYDSPNS